VTSYWSDTEPGFLASLRLYKYDLGGEARSRRPTSISAESLSGEKAPEAAGAKRQKMYSEKVLDHFEHPRNIGELPSPDAEVRLEHQVCGDIMSLSVKIAEGRIDQVRYRTRGCVASIAAGSCLTEMIQGKSLAEASALQRENLLEALGGLPNASIHPTHLAMDALAQVLKKLSSTRV
jgi:nitrogen fixation NifU-like protein